MNDLKRYSLALGVIAILALFKFVFVPILAWQDQKLARLALLEKKLAKIERLRTNKEQLVRQQEEIFNHLSALAPVFNPSQAPESLQLKQQKIIESELARYDLKLVSIGWKTPLDLEVTPLIRNQVEYGFSGATEKTVEYLMALNGRNPAVDLNTLDFSFRNQRKGKLGSVTVRIRASYYIANYEISGLATVTSRANGEVFPADLVIGDLK